MPHSGREPAATGLPPVPLPGPHVSARVSAGQAQPRPTCPVGLEGVPDVAVEVVVAREQEAPAPGEGHGRDPADDVVVGVSHELLIRAEVEQPAGSVVRASGKRVAVWKELERESEPR